MPPRSQDVEILVHVNAPSRVADDATYRQLAQAYLSFEPCSSIDLPEQEDEERVSDAPRHHQYEDIPRPFPSLEFAPSTASRPIVIDSQDLSFQSVVDNRASPRLQANKQIQPQVQAASFSSGIVEDAVELRKPWSASPSQISDSYPMPLASATYTSPTRVLENFTNQQLSSSPRGTPPSPTAPHRTQEPPRRDEAVGVPFSRPSNEPGIRGILRSGYINAQHIIPFTPPVSATRKRTEEAGNVEEDPAWDVTHISASDASIPPPSTSSFRAESEPPPAKKSKTGDIIETAKREAKNLVRSSSDTGAARKAPILDPRQSDTLEIRPPSPPVGINDINPASLVPTKLAKLEADLSSRYRPEAARELQPLERGYWLLECRSWSEESRINTWAFLTSYLRSGLAGWGVWCRRDPAHGWIRLYCWGHIAKHTYLLLYLASERQLKFTGAEWRDGGGDVVLRVLPHDRPA